MSILILASNDFSLPSADVAFTDTDLDCFVIELKSKDSKPSSPIDSAQSPEIVRNQLGSMALNLLILTQSQNNLNRCL